MNEKSPAIVEALFDRQTCVFEPSMIEEIILPVESAVQTICGIASASVRKRISLARISSSICFLLIYVGECAKPFGDVAVIA